MCSSPRDRKPGSASRTGGDTGGSDRYQSVRGGVRVRRRSCRKLRSGCNGRDARPERPTRSAPNGHSLPDGRGRHDTRSDRNSTRIPVSGNDRPSSTPAGKPAFSRCAIGRGCPRRAQSRDLFIHPLRYKSLWLRSDRRFGAHRKPAEWPCEVPLCVPPVGPLAAVIGVRVRCGRDASDTNQEPSGTFGNRRSALAGRFSVSSGLALRIWVICVGVVGRQCLRETSNTASRSNMPCGG